MAESPYKFVYFRHKKCLSLECVLSWDWAGLGELARTTFMDAHVLRLLRHYESESGLESRLGIRFFLCE